MSLQNPGAEKLQMGNLEHLQVEVLEKQTESQTWGGNVVKKTGSKSSSGATYCSVQCTVYEQIKKIVDFTIHERKFYITHLT